MMRSDHGRILVINPNASLSCTQGIAAALARLTSPGLPRFEVIRLEDGPPAVATWRDWFDVAGPVCQRIEQEQALAYIIACVSDPGFEAARLATPRPVLGLLRSAVAASLALGAERFGILGFMESSRARQRRVLQAMGVEHRLAAYEPLGLPMETLTDPRAARARLAQAARAVVAQGAEAVVLGCAGMAGHVAAIEDAVGVPVIEPCLAAGAQALAAVLGGEHYRLRPAA
jgi:Asp/Glu/hydantoin racemase